MLDAKLLIFALCHLFGIGVLDRHFVNGIVGNYFFLKAKGILIDLKKKLSSIFIVTVTQKSK